MIQFGTNTFVLPFEDDKKTHTASVHQSDNGVTTFPASKLRHRGFKVSEVSTGVFKVTATRNRVVAKLQSVDGSEFIKRVIMECEGDRCELKAEAPKSYWDVEQLTDNTFLIKRA